MLSLAGNTDQNAISNPIGRYGRAELMRSGSKLRRKRPTEVIACKHLLTPDDADFEAPAEMPSLLYCCKCRQRKPHEAFGKDKRNVNRWGRKTECLPCSALIAKESRLRQRRERKKAAQAGV